MSGWRNRIVGHGEEPPDQLLANPANWRTHPKSQQDALAGSLGEVGWVQQVVVNRTTGHVVDGHLRIGLAISRNEPAVPVTYVELTEAEEALILATLDPIAAMAGADREALDNLLREVGTGDAALQQLLADVAKDAGLDYAKAGLTDPDEVPPQPVDVYVKPGDLWLLGDHRLLCGDARSAEGVRRTLTGPVDLLCMDPPYGVAIGAKNRTLDMIDRAGRRKENLSGDDGQEEAVDLWRASFPVLRAVLAPGVPWYCFGPQGGDLGLLLLLLLRDSGLTPRHILMWKKNRPSFSIGRLDYDYAHEPIVYGWIDGAGHRWYADTPQSSVLEYDRPQASPDHPTTKPVDLIEHLIHNSTRPGEVVFDPFVGSGTAIIAAEQLGRRCYAMDIEPRYVQVAKERWEKFTGREATLEAS